jgi:hypothetical protein
VGTSDTISKLKFRQAEWFFKKNIPIKRGTHLDSTKKIPSAFVIGNSQLSFENDVFDTWYKDQMCCQ